MDGPGSNPGGGEIFSPSRPALGSTQPAVRWVPGFYWGESGRAVTLTFHPLLVPWSRKSTTMPLIPLMARTAFTEHQWLYNDVFYHFTFIGK